MPSGTSSARASLAGSSLHQPHRVVAHVAEDAGGDRRQPGGSSMRHSASKRAERGRARRRGAARSASRSGPRLISAFAAGGAPDQVRVEADDGIAPAHGAALDRFQQEAHCGGCRRASEAETGVSRSATSRVQTTCGAPALVVCRRRPGAGSTCITAFARAGELSEDGIVDSTSRGRRGAQEDCRMSLRRVSKADPCWLRVGRLGKKGRRGTRSTLSRTRAGGASLSAFATWLPARRRTARLRSAELAGGAARVLRLPPSARACRSRRRSWRAVAGLQALSRASASSAMRFCAPPSRRSRSRP